MGSAMANIEGKQYSLTCISPMKPWRRRILQLFFWVRSLGLFGGRAKKLKQLSFIHFARWTIVKRDQFPHLGYPQPDEDLKYDYLIFCSNFNGTWDQYIDAFSHVIPGGMDSMWRWSEKYPKSIPTTPFKEYIRHNQIDSDYYYSAYPGAATNDVKAALHLSGELHEFAQRTQNLGAEEFAAEYHKFLTRVSSDLGTTGPLDHSQTN